MMAYKYPREVEFYVPQLCTYLFHFTNQENSTNESFVHLEHPMPEGPGILPDDLES